MGLALAAGAPFLLRAVGHWLAYTPGAAPADVIAVFGGAQERTRYGIALNKEGLAPEIWHTGYARHQDTVIAYIARRSPPNQAIRYLPSNSTWEDAQAIGDMAKERSITRLLVVTSWYHSRRAMCTIKSQLAGSGIEIAYDAPPLRDGGPEDWWRYDERRRQVASELVKLAYYWLRFGMSPWRC